MFLDVEFYLPGMKVTRFSIKKGDKIPLHSHPNQYGLFFVLEGKCALKKYQVLNKGKTSYKIQLIEERTLVKNEYSVITPINNIHTLIAEEDSVLLDIFSPGVTDGRLSEFLNIISANEDPTYSIVEPIDMSKVEMADYLKDTLGHQLIVKD